MVRRYTLFAAILWAFLGAAAEGQELTTDAERDWKAIRSSEDVRTKVMAERWYNAVRQQDWSDTSGKFKVSAKYVEHDPKLAWVKLRVFRGTGKERQVKDVQIPLDKLSKTCQARVRTISVLAEKIATAKEDEAEKAAEADGDSGDPNDRSNYDEPEADEPRIDSGPMESGLAEMDPSEVMEGRDRRGGRGRERAAESSPAVANTGPPLPAALPPLPTAATASVSTPAAEQPAAAPSTEAAAVDPASIPPLDAATPYFPDSDPWRTDYEEFRTAFEKDPDTGTIATPKSWPGVLNLQLFVPIEVLQAQERGAPPAFVEAPRLAEVGDFQWQGNIVQSPSAEANWAEVLGLAPLPEPLKLELRLQGGGRDGVWQQLNSREPVRFVGRFIGYRGPYTWVAEIRLLPNEVRR